MDDHLAINKSYFRKVVVVSAIKRKRSVKLLFRWTEKTFDTQSKEGVNFINVFMGRFYTCRSQTRKKLLELTVFLALLGSASVKAARKMLVKLSQGVSQPRVSSRILRNKENWLPNIFAHKPTPPPRAPPTILIFKKRP